MQLPHLQPSSHGEECLRTPNEQALLYKASFLLPLKVCYFHRLIEDNLMLPAMVSLVRYQFVSCLTFIAFNSERNRRQPDCLLIYQLNHSKHTFSIHRTRLLLWPCALLVTHISHQSPALHQFFAASRNPILCCMVLLPFKIKQLNCNNYNIY